MLSAAAPAVAAENAPAPATAELYPLFQRLCLDTEANEDKAIAAAEGMGWTEREPPKDMNGTSGHAEGRVFGDPTGAFKILVSHGAAEFFGPSTKIDGVACAVARFPPDAGAIEQAKNFAAIPPAPSLCADEKDTCFAWTDQGGTHVTFTGGPTGTAISTLAVHTDDVATILCIGVGKTTT
jgi:hypothetical protein